MKKFIYVISFLFVGTLTANAYIDSQHMTSEQALVNQGYSRVMATSVNASMINPYAPTDQKTDKRTIYQKIYNYIDPVSGGNKSFPAHDTKIDSNWQDL